MNDSSQRSAPACDPPGVWRRGCVAAVCVALMVLSPEITFAQSTADIEAQGNLRMFQLRTLDGGEVVPRRSITQILGMSASHRAQPEGPEFTVVTRLRLDTDLGLEDSIAARLDNNASQFIAEDLQLAFVRASGLFGRLDLSLGRDLVMDPTGAFTLDGLQVELRSPAGWFVSAYGGMPVLPGRTLSRGDTAFGADWVEPQARIADDTLLSLGAAFGYRSRRWRTSFSAKRTLSISEASSLETPDELPPDNITGRALSDDKIGGAAHVRPTEGLELSGDGVWNLSLGLLERGHGGLLVHLPWHGLAVGLRAESSTPVFPTGSIFSVFGARPSSAWRLVTSADLDPGLGGLALDAEVGLRAYGAPLSTAPALPLTSGADTHTLHTRLAGRWRVEIPERRWLTGFDVHGSISAEPGYLGLLVLSQAGGRLQLLRNRAWLRTRVLALVTQRDQQPLQNGASVAAQLSGGYVIGSRSRIEGTLEYGSTATFLHALSFFMTYQLDYTLME